MTSTYFMRAISDGLMDAMTRDERIIVLGEDVEMGVLGETRGLFDRFGAERVRNTPISEATVTGACIGAAAAGLRPVADLMFSSFFYLAMDQLANQAARFRYMSGGQVTLPILYLAGTGPGGSLAAQHSENPHSILMHISGLKVVMPSTPADAKALIYESLADPNPVIYLIDLALAGQKGDISDDAAPSQRLGRAEVRRQGEDVSLVTLGSMVRAAVEVAEDLSVDGGPSVEVIDLRSLVPLDWATIEQSIGKTGRLIVADPAREMCGLGGELLARAAERNWEGLKVPPQRVTWANLPIPFAPGLERTVVFGREELRAAIMASVGESNSRLATAKRDDR